MRDLIISIFGTYTPVTDAAGTVSVAGLKTLTLEFSPRRNARAAP